MQPIRPYLASAPELTLLYLSALLAVTSGLVWWQIVGTIRGGGLPLRFRERRKPHYHRFVVALTLAWIALQVYSRVIADLRGLRPDPSIGQVQFACAVSIFTWGTLLGLLRIGSESRLRDFGIDVAGWWRSLIDGALGFLASVLPVIFLLLATWPIRTQETQHSFFRLLREHPGPATVGWIVLAVVALAPLAEELVFRVTLQGWLQTRVRPTWAIGIGAVVFSAVHGWPDAVPLLPLAVILGYVYWRRHDYLAVVVLHGLFNGVMLIVAMLSESSPGEVPAVGG